MSEQELTPRQERAAERILEDEGLTGGLTDEPARALIGWAQAAALRAAAPPERDDAQVTALVQAVSRAARQAAAGAAADSAALIAAADSALARLAPELAPTANRGRAPAPAADPTAPLAVRRIALIAHRAS